MEDNGCVVTVGVFVDGGKSSARSVGTGVMGDGCTEWSVVGLVSIGAGGGGGGAEAAKSNLLTILGEADVGVLLLLLLLFLDDEAKIGLSAVCTVGILGGGMDVETTGAECGSV